MMDNQEARRITVIEQTREGKFNNREAAELLGLSIRQIQRLKRKAEADGSTAVLHGNRGRRPHKVLPEESRATVIRLANEALKENNYMHMQEVLEGEYGVNILYSSLSAGYSEKRISIHLFRRNTGGNINRARQRNILVK